MLDPERYQGMLAKLIRDVTGHEKLSGQYCVQPPQVGRQWNGDLAVYGRAVNGWLDKYDWHELTSKPGAEEVAKEMWEHTEGACKYLLGIPEEGLEDCECGGDPMHWVEHRRRPHSKKPMGSPLMQLAKRVVAQYHRCSGDASGWSSKLAYSNLFKFAPERGNPDRNLKKLQLSHCIEILLYELQELKPRNVVFVTEGNPREEWFSYFREPLGWRRDKAYSPPWPVVETGSFKCGPQECRGVVTVRPDRRGGSRSDFAKAIVDQLVPPAAL
jgi:hypothetical protein